MNKPKTTIIAEAGVNHNGNINLALQLIDAAAEAGADVVKFQTFCAEELVSTSAPKANYQLRSTDPAESQYEMLKKLELTHEQHYFLKKHCEKRNIAFLSTPFDSISADFLLDKMKLNTIKISSGEITTAPLLLQIARYQPNTILSTGMATLGEIEDALAIIAFGFLNTNEAPSTEAFIKAYASIEGQIKLKQKVTLLHCTSDYPAKFDAIHLRAMDTLKSAFDLPVGYSDHSMGIAVPIAAVARGATVIEKHFTLDRSLPGPDHLASLEPLELKNMVKSIREVECALGSTLKIPTQSELEIKNVARKSLMAAKTIIKNELFTEKNLSMQRPGIGISPMRYWDYLGSCATQNYQEDEPIQK
ncbi:MAG: N-acetylneuraminate synthase [Gammaproteobacteria bacterium]|nr:N-acetylneuraminate synthase [Gammaproteobacteria bacterium]